MNQHARTMKLCGALADAERAMGFPADHTIVLDKDTARGDARHHRHVAIAWEGGVLWLDMSDLGDHYCIDVREFDGPGEELPIGVFAIENGRRYELAETGLKSRDWNAATMPILVRAKAGPLYRAMPATPGEHADPKINPSGGPMGWVVVKGEEEECIAFGDGYMDEHVARRRAAALNAGRPGTDIPNDSV